MDNQQQNYEQTLERYKQVLNNLKEQCANAEKKCIIAQTSKENYIPERENLIKECEQLSGTTIDKVPELIKSYQKTLDDIVQSLEQIDIKEPYTEDKLNELIRIVNEYSINIKKG